MYYVFGVFINAFYTHRKCAMVEGSVCAEVANVRRAILELSANSVGQQPIQ